MPLACLAAVVAVPTPGSSQGAFDQGRTVTRLVLAGDVTTLQPYLSPKFIQAIGGPTGLASFSEKLKAQAGRELEVLEEHAFREAGGTTYYRVSRFEKIPSLTTRWVWGDNGLIIGGTARPTAEPAASPHLAYRTKAALQLPLAQPQQGTWYVAWGGRDAVHNKHVVSPDQRFAYDLVVMESGKVFRGDGARNEDHFCFGAPIVAPAAGTVVSATDGEADNRPGDNKGKTEPGNSVIIDHGQGEYSLFAHLRSGSVAVKNGQRVAAGDAVGSCGNSGKSDLPHLHYHLQTGRSYLQGLGLPTQFNGYFLGGRFVERGEPRRGDLLTPAPPRVVSK
jgi:murein DD-endopeptidase MepM/ murein hydrolase activator NlpD